MADLISMLAACGATEGEPTDPDFNQTVLLLHGDGTNGAQNNTFLDSSTNNFTITRNPATGPNAPTQGTFSPFSGPNGYWSNFFDGTNDRLTIADNAALRPGTSAFTIEAWVYRAAAGAAHTIFAKGASTPTGFAFLVTSSDTLRFTDTSTDITSTGTVAANTWVHVAAVREGTGTNQLKLYINGVQDGTGTSSTDFTQTEEARIGENRGATDDFNGYISNFRYVIGTALYTAGFTPSTSPLTTTSQGATSSQVELLTCQSNRFLDNSSNAFTVSPVNNVRVTPFSPFAPSAAYDPAVNGGSGYFDGTGDYLTVANASALQLTNSVAWCIETWFYASAMSAQQHIFHGYNPNSPFQGWGIALGASTQAATTLMFWDGTTWRNIATSLTPNQWYHVAVTYEGSGTTGRLFLNGTQQGSAFAPASTINNTSNAIGIGGQNNGSLLFTGYVSNARIVKGSAVYTSNFSPTAPLTAITNTSLLLNFTNAGIFDNTGKNVLETVGNAQIDTTTKKFGTGSMEFDGNDYLDIPSNVDLTLGTGDFTVECWLYWDSSKATIQLFIDWRPASTNGVYPALYVASNGAVVFYVSSADRITTSTISANTWTHVALVRLSGSTKIYINGTASGSTYSDTNNYLQGRVRIGDSGFSTVDGFGYKGFIDDLRITKGVARYTAAFTPPTAAFPNE